MKYLTLLSFLFLSIVVTSCRTPKDLEFREFKNLKLENMGFSSSRVSVDLIYYNPNNFGLELKQTDFDVYIDKNFLGHSAQDLQVSVKKRNEFVLPLKLDLDMKNLIKNGLTAFLNKTVTIRVVGKVKVGKAGVFKSFPVDYSTIQTLSL